MKATLLQWMIRGVAVACGILFVHATACTKIEEPVKVIKPQSADSK